jgi:dCTP deaminase
MILSDSEILKQIQSGDIVITPFVTENLGSNSYDVTLGSTIKTYKTYVNYELDSAGKNAVQVFEIPATGYVLLPGILYLAVTQEYTETRKCVPYLEGKSSLARLGISIHQTAGKGDVGFKGYWTMEITVAIPVRVYAGMKIGQLIYNEVKGEVLLPYDKKSTAKYNNAEQSPMQSKNNENF